jgi:hypothetical protein
MRDNYRLQGGNQNFDPLKQTKLSTAKEEAIRKL